MRSLVLGLGNEVLKDDGVGLCAARRVAERAGGRADLALACMASIDLLPIMAGYDRVVVVDAYRSPTAAPGTPVHAAAEELPAGFGYRSPHTLPFAEMLAFGRELGLPMPREVSVHGLCVGDASTFGESFTPAVARAWRRWADGIAAEEFEGPGGPDEG